MLLGCIADDLTGATDLALTLVRSGMRTLQVVGVPSDGRRLPAADAVVVALKSRTVPPREAVRDSLASAEALLASGAQQLFFKYCSTFDSTDHGNIGPVIDVLMDRLDCSFTLACPAFPGNQRTVFQGHLFVGRQLLSHSPLKDHPLTPMRDANLVSVLARQTRREVGLVPFECVDAGPSAISAGFREAMEQGKQIVIVDAISDRHLLDIGQAAADLPLITGGSGVALGLPENFRRRGLLSEGGPAEPFTAPEGPAAILSGSCSAATRDQVAEAIAAGIAAYQIDALALSKGRTGVADILDWARAQGPARPILIYSTALPESVRQVQQSLGQGVAGALVEDCLASAARGLCQEGWRRFLVAGGETSGAVVQALGIEALEIGPEIDPGVPWTVSRGGTPLALALKSGNFGTADFFIKAWDSLP